jgi:hypothetical protein
MLRLLSNVNLQTEEELARNLAQMKIMIQGTPGTI